MKPKKSAIKHTPTPWWRHESPNDYEATLIEGNHRVIAAIRSENESKPTQEERANADFILRACNSHDELVVTLQECLEDIQDAHDNHIYSDDDEHPKSKDDCRYCCTMDRIKAALRKAQGR